MTIETSDFKPSGATPGLAPARAELGNGTVVIVKETRKTPAVTINLAVRAGSICDPPDLLGAMHLLSKTIDRGTVDRSAADIAAELDNRGISLSIGVTRHLFSLACTCLAADFDAVLALVADIVMHPQVPQSELMIRKGEAITLLRQDEDNPSVRALEEVMALLYGPTHPYGRRSKGTIETMERLTRDELLRLHAAHCAPAALSAVVVGDVSTSRVLDVADRVFGSWRGQLAAPFVLPRAVPATARRRIIVPMMNKAQADIAYGFTTIARADPDYCAFSVMNNVLGQYALGGRLGDSIRERQGMAYYVSSTFDPNVVEGPLLIRAGVSAANVERAIASIDEEIESLVRDGVTDRELSESRQFMIGSMPRTLETNGGIAQFLQTAEFFRLGLDYDVRLPRLLEAVTADEIRTVAARYLDPGRASIVVAGPYAG